MARTVADAAALLTVLAGYDPEDPATAPLKDRPPLDYTHFLNANSLRGVRIGVMRHYAGFHEKVDAAFESALATLRAQGAVLVDPVDIPTRRSSTRTSRSSCSSSSRTASTATCSHASGASPAHSRRVDPLQRPARRHRDAVFRAGAVHPIQCPGRPERLALYRGP